MSGEKKCDATAAIVFIVGLIAGTGCIIAAKVLFELKSIGKTGKVEMFKPPVFETWVMFFGMLFALPTYLLTEWRRKMQAKTDRVLREKMESEPKVTIKMLFTLGVPALFDLSSVLLMMIGLMEINSSMWMLLRGGGIVFVALMKQYVLGDNLSAQMWVGVATIALAVVLVGSAGFLESSNTVMGNVPYGVAMTIAGTFMQSLQYVYEEKVMSGDTGAPPWLLIGMEGLFGTLLCTFVVYPIAGFVPGSDHGVYEDLSNTLAMLKNNPMLLQFSIVFCVLVFILNSFSVLVTFMLSSVWHAILDNFRPITIWLVELAMYYVFTNGAHGESWTKGSFLQLAGLIVMLFGTAIYNGSIAVPGIDQTNLLERASTMATPALTRSPLLTHSPLAEPIAGSTSPYAATRSELPVASGPGDLKQKLLAGGGKR
mmetsp:Transcript_16275/g.34904  ORF Transcript_16275/g.34904 Transcript_16275/m.34904 type:complete len:427 (+) Transcript_16275:37-1317(+)